MIPIYDAIEFKSLMEGGRTSPWLILANVHGQAQAFVMKLYKIGYMMGHDIVMKELMAFELARAFEIGTPESAIINITPQFIKTLKPSQLKQLRESGDNPKFAT